MSTTDPRQKNEKSKYVAGAYTVSNILRSEAHIDQTFKSFLGWLDTYSRTREPMDLSKFISYATFDVIGQIAFSQPFGFLAQGKDINNAISNSLALNAYVAVAGYFRWLNVALLANPVVTWLSIMPMGHLFDTTAAVLADRAHSPDKRFDAVQYWFKQRDQHPDKLSVREINTQALAAVGAGSDTVACGIQSFVYHMIRHRDAWGRARAEVNDAMARGLCRDRVVSYAHALQLPYLLPLPSLSPLHSLTQPQVPTSMHQRSAAHLQPRAHGSPARCASRRRDHRRPYAAGRHNCVRQPVGDAPLSRALG